MTVLVKGVAPRFLTLRVPKSLSARARQVRLRVAATQPATLRAAGRRLRVGRRARTVRLRLRPGRGDLSLRLRLSSRSRSSALNVLIPRG